MTVSDVDLDGRCQCCSATGGLKRNRQDVHDACQDDAKGDDIDVKQTVEHVVDDNADLVAKVV